jgi:hypothetical protein
MREVRAVSPLDRADCRVRDQSRHIRRTLLADHHVVLAPQDQAGLLDVGQEAIHPRQLLLA